MLTAKTADMTGNQTDKLPLMSRVNVVVSFLFMLIAVPLIIIPVGLLLVPNWWQVFVLHSPYCWGVLGISVVLGYGNAIRYYWREKSRLAESRFLIMGCQRSGTTLLGMVLESHPQIEMIEENDLRFHGNGALTRELKLDAVLKNPAVDGGLTGYKAPRDSHRLDEFAHAVPPLRVLWIERDKY